MLLLRGAGAAGYATELWTLRRISEVIRKRFGVCYSPVGVWALLRHGLQWSWQKRNGAPSSATRRPSPGGSGANGRG